MKPCCKKTRRETAKEIFREIENSGVGLDTTRIKPVDGDLYDKIKQKFTEGKH